MRSRPGHKRETITDLQDIRLNYPQQSFDETVFPASEKAAIARLRQFCAQGRRITRRGGIFQRLKPPAACRPV